MTEPQQFRYTVAVRRHVGQRYVDQDQFSVLDKDCKNPPTGPSDLADKLTKVVADLLGCEQPQIASRRKAERLNSVLKKPIRNKR